VRRDAALDQHRRTAGSTANLARKYPDVQARLVEFRHTIELIAAMEAGQADLAVDPTPPARDWPVREIGAEEFVLAAAPGACPARRSDRPSPQSPGGPAGHRSPAAGTGVPPEQGI
jgi:DNA-binding transcriptional LysR family regulator